MEKIAILGISAFFHDSAAALIVDGRIVAAAQEERFTRIKHDNSFPLHAVRYVLDESGISYEKLSAIVFYDKPFLKMERLLETYHAFAPKGLRSFITSMPIWLKEKLFMRRHLRKQLEAFGKTTAPLLFSDHHLSHAASAFYPSSFEDAAILTVDGVGEWATATIGIGEKEQISVLKEMHFPHSVGLLYSAFTYYLGFKVNSGEYKLMGLAPYGNPEAEQTARFKEKIITALVDIREDGSMLLNMKYFCFATGLRMTDDKRWEKLFGLSRREPESDILQAHMNLALAIQQVTEMIVVRMARTAHEITGKDCLVMAGGVALNCVANSKIISAGYFRDVWIQPAAGDAGGALGAALAAYHLYFGQKRVSIESADSTTPEMKLDNSNIRSLYNKSQDNMSGAFLGPAFADFDIRKALDNYDAGYNYFVSTEELLDKVSKELCDGKIVGWFQGRMEFGPRALGNRSILADPRNPDIQKTLNMKIKFREGFRPFAPAVLEEDAARYFSLPLSSSLYMLLIGSVKDEHRLPKPSSDMIVDSSEADSESPETKDIYKRLYCQRSVVPAITHIDYSARVQTVSKDSNSLFYELLCNFKKYAGIGMLVNTSFNTRGEPVVCTPEDAYIDFMSTEMDCLVLGNYLLYKENQQPLPQEKRKQTIELD